MKYFLSRASILFFVTIFSINAFGADSKMTDVEFMECNKVVESILLKNKEHEEIYVAPVDYLEEQLEAIDFVRDALTEEAELSSGESSETLLKTREMLIQFHYRQQAKLEVKQQSLISNKKILIDSQVSFREQCLTGSRITKSLKEKFCPERNSLAICGLFK